MAKKVNLIVDQGTTFEVVVDVDTANVTWNLANFNGRSAIKKHFGSLTNTTNFNVSVDANASTVTLSLTPNLTSNVIPGRYVYDTEIYDGDTVYRIIEGMVFITPEVTK